MRRWTDLRLWLGIALVLAAVVIGGRVLAGADTTVPVPVLRHDVTAGSRLSVGDLGTARVHFDDSATAAVYFSSVDDLPANAIAAHDLARGQLLPKTAVVDDRSKQVVEVPIAVPPTGIPSGLTKGDHVDVWTVRDVSGKAKVTGTAELVMTDVVMLSVSADPSGVDSSDRQVLLALPAAADDQVAKLLESVHGADVVLIRHGG